MVFSDVKKLKGILLVAIGSILWGASGVSGQYLLQYRGLHSGELVMLRMICAGIILLTIDIILHRQNIFSIWLDKRYRLSLVFFSLLGMLGVQYTYFATISYSNAATATILQYLMPIVIILYLAIVKRTLPSKKECLCIVLAMLGTFLIITHGNFTSLVINKKALFWGILSSFSAAFYTMQPKYLLCNCRSSLVIGWALLVGGLVLGLLQQNDFHLAGRWDIVTYANMGYIIIFGSVIAFSAYLESVKYIKASEMGIMSSLEPLSAIVFLALILHIYPGWPEYVGTFLILSTVFILARK